MKEGSAEKLQDVPGRLGAGGERGEEEGPGLELG